MRLNLDSGAINEPRIRRIAKALGVSHYDILGRFCHLWMVCYERRTEFISDADADIAAGELPGFVAATITNEMADRVDDTMIRVRGVVDRINFLEKQSIKGKLSGMRRREMSDELQKLTSAQQGINFGSTDGSTEQRTSSLDPDPDLAPDLAPDHVPFSAGHSFSGSSSPQNRASARATGGQGSDEGKASKTQPRSAGERVERAERSVPDPPAEALTLSELLMGLILTNNPEGRLARSTPRLKEKTIVAWANTVRKMNEIDGFKWGEISGMITWSQRDPFWRTNILGADKLREKWDTMAMQRNRVQNGVSARNQGRPSPSDLARQEVAELERSGTGTK